MNIYLVIILILALCVGSAYEILTSRTSKTIAFVILGLFILCIATRDNTTPDTKPYIEAYEKINFGNMRYHDFNIGFSWIICLFKTFGFKVEFFFGFIALMNYCICYYACKNILKECIIADNRFLNQINLETDISFKPCIFSAFFIPYFGLFYSGVAIRSSLAMSLVMLSSLYLCRHKNIMYVLLIIIAMFFHSSAILGICVFICYKLTLHKKQEYLLCWIGIAIIWISHISLAIIRVVPVIIHQLYELTKIGSFKLYEMLYASSLRLDAFWGKKELFFGVCGLLLVILGWNGNRVYHQMLTVFFFGILLAFALEYIMTSYRIIDYFLLFFVPSGCVGFMQREVLHKRERHCIEIAAIVILQTVVAIRVIGFA